MKKATEVKVIDDENDDAFPQLETTVKCPYCKTGDIELSFQAFGTNILQFC